MNYIKTPIMSSLTALKLFGFITVLILSGCSGYVVNIQGIPVTEIERDEIPYAIAGAIIAYAVHEYAHIHKMKQHDLEYTFTFPNQLQYWGGDRETQIDISKAGFRSMIIGGAILNLIPWTKDSPFTLGFNMASSLGALSYYHRYPDTKGDYRNQTDSDWVKDCTLTTLNLAWTINNRR
jgi:hypothetical protein